MSVIAENFTGEYRSGGVFSKGEKAELENFLKEGDYASWIETAGAFQEAPRDVKTVGALLVGGSNVYRTTTAPFEATCLWKAPTSDGCECVFEAKILVEANSEEFLKIWSGRIRADKRLSSVSIENSLIVELDREVADKIKSHTFDELKDGRELSLEWWRTFFDLRVENFGLTFDSIVRVDYSAPTLERERELEKREETRREAIEQNKAEAETAVRLAEIEAEKTERIRMIEHNKALSEARRREEREKLEAEMETRRKKIERDAELQSLEHEQKRLELEAQNENIKNRPEERKEIQETLQRVEERLEKFAKETNRYFQAFQDARESDLTPSSQLATRVSGISDDTFDRLTPRDSKERFSRFFEGAFKKAPESKRVKIAVENSKKRSVGDVKIKTLKINESLVLKFKSPIDGYVSVLNLGSEYVQPNYLLLVPNKRLEPRDAFVNKGETARVPSKKFQLKEMYELGPKGWEEFVVLITKEPLFDDEDRAEIAPRCENFATLSAERLRRILERLATLDEDERAIGWVGYNVVD